MFGGYLQPMEGSTTVHKHNVKKRRFTRRASAAIAALLTMVGLSLIVVGTAGAKTAPSVTVSASCDGEVVEVTVNGSGLPDQTINVSASYSGERQGSKPLATGGGISESYTFTASGNGTVTGRILSKDGSVELTDSTQVVCDDPVTTHPTTDPTVPSTTDAPSTDPEPCPYGEHLDDKLGCVPNEPDDPGTDPTFPTDPTSPSDPTDDPVTTHPTTDPTVPSTTDAPSTDPEPCPYGEHLDDKLGCVPNEPDDPGTDPTFPTDPTSPSDPTDDPVTTHPTTDPTVPSTDEPVTTSVVTSTVQAVPGPQGPQGPAGPTGPIGPQGPQGDSGSTVVNATVVVQSDSNGSDYNRQDRVGPNAHTGFDGTISSPAVASRSIWMVTAGVLLLLIAVPFGLRSRRAGA